MSDKKQVSLGADASLLTLSKIAVSAMSMIMAMLLARFRTKAEMGTYNSILMVINLATSLLMLGLPKSINYFLARAETNEERKRFLSVYYTFNTILSFIVGAVLCASVRLIEIYFGNDTIRYFLYFLAVFPWTKIIMSSVENLLIVYRRTKWLIAYRVSNSVMLIVAILAVRALGLSFTEYMVVYVAVEAVFALAVYLLAARVSGGIRPSFDRELLKRILVFSVPLGLASVVGTLNIELDKFLIGALMSPEDLAVYSNAARELPVTMIASAFTAVLLPQFARLLKHGHKEEAIRLWGVSNRLTFIIISIIAFGCFTFAGEVMTILYSSQYAEGAWVFRIYSLILLFRTTYYGIILNSKGKSKFIFWCSIISLGLNALLNVIFYFVFSAFGQGFVAPAVATFFSTLIMALVQLIATARSIEMPFSKLLPWGKLAKITLVNIAFSAVFFTLSRLLPIDTMLDRIDLPLISGSGKCVEAVLLGIVWAICYFGLMIKPMKRLWRQLKAPIDLPEAVREPEASSKES